MGQGRSKGKGRMGVSVQVRSSVLPFITRGSRDGRLSDSRRSYLKVYEGRNAHKRRLGKVQRGAFLVMERERNEVVNYG